MGAESLGVFASLGDDGGSSCKGRLEDDSLVMVSSGGVGMSSSKESAVIPDAVSIVAGGLLLDMMFRETCGLSASD
jgi:hypothetical protein